MRCLWRQLWHGARLPLQQQRISSCAWSTPAAGLVGEHRGQALAHKVRKHGTGPGCTGAQPRGCTHLAAAALAGKHGLHGVHVPCKLLLVLLLLPPHLVSSCAGSVQLSPAHSCGIHTPEAGFWPWCAAMQGHTAATIYSEQLRTLPAARRTRQSLHATTSYAASRELERRHGTSMKPVVWQHSPDSPDKLASLWQAQRPATACGASGGVTAHERHARRLLLFGFVSSIL